MTLDLDSTISINLVVFLGFVVLQSHIIVWRYQGIFNSTNSVMISNNQGKQVHVNELKHESSFIRVNKWVSGCLVWNIIDNWSQSNDLM